MDGDVTFTWKGARENLERLAEANYRAWMQSLRALTEEESIAIFEDLTRGFPELEPEHPPRHRPIALFRIWRS